MRLVRGFTLIELAVALAVIGLLLGMLIVPLNAQIDQQRVNEARKQLALINEALLGFAVSNGRLPCPAIPGTANTTAGAGTENKPAAACGITHGVVPWATLGVPETDPWGWRFTYRVTGEFANDPPLGLQATLALADNGDMTVKAATGGVNIATGVGAMVVSHGKNGLGAYQTSGTQKATTGAGADELENTNADATFVSKLPEPTYDDAVLWLSTHVLKSRMVAANRLP
jgi:prepilin-type N-terminal cleavage/methylation domain-containing protein